jgi:hypothetical protein
VRQRSIRNRQELLRDVMVHTHLSAAQAAEIAFSLVRASVILGISGGEKLRRRV